MQTTEVLHDQLLGYGVWHGYMAFESQCMAIADIGKNTGKTRISKPAIGERLLFHSSIHPLGWVEHTRGRGSPIGSKSPPIVGQVFTDSLTHSLNSPHLNPTDLTLSTRTLNLQGLHISKHQTSHTSSIHFQPFVWNIVSCSKSALKDSDEGLTSKRPPSAKDKLLFWTDFNWLFEDVLNRQLHWNLVHPDLDDGI